MLLCLMLPAAHALTVRDGIGSFTNVQTSTHFALKWGDEAPDAAHAQATLDALEAAWTVLVDEHGWPAPVGSDAYYVNVYMADSGGDAPSITFDGAYASEDDEGYAYMVLAPGLVALFSGEDPDDIAAGAPVPWVQEVCAHEFAHTIQFGTGAFRTDFYESYWAWESGANASARLVVPDGEIALYQSLYYWVTPYLPLDALADDSVDAPAASGRIYGAWTWWAYLDEVVDAPELMQQMWTSAGASDTALDVLLLHMDDAALDFEPLFLDFAVHNATFDYSFGDAARGWLERDEADVGGERIVARWDSAGTPDWASPPSVYGLHRASYNVIELTAPGDQVWTVELESDNEAVAATVVLQRTDGITQHPLVDGLVEVSTTAEDETLLLVVAATRTGGVDGKDIAYQYRLTPKPEVVSEAAACGCASTPEVGLAALFPLLLLRRSPRSRRPR